MTQLLDSDAIHGLLVDLDSELVERGARAELFLVGGAAMALAFDTRRVTRDLDAVFAPTSVVRAAARTIAQRRDLDEDWLNDAVKGFLPGEDSDRQHYFVGRALTVDVASLATCWR
jgi:hypothetical protein